MTTIWHNPRCSKSRQTLALLQDRGIEPEQRLYLSNGPSIDEIRSVLDMLGVVPSNLMRTQDTLFRDLGLTKDMPANALIAAMAEHPALIERPIVISNGKAAIGRPPEAVLDIL